MSEMNKDQILVITLVLAAISLSLGVARRDGLWPFAPKRVPVFRAAVTWQCVPGTGEGDTIETGIPVDHAERLLSISETDETWRFYIDGSLVCEAYK